MSSIFPLEITKPLDIVSRKATRGDTAFAAGCTFLVKSSLTVNEKGYAKGKF